jgi:hypothetical protein
LKCEEEYPKFEQHYCQIEKVYGHQVKKAVSNFIFYDIESIQDKSEKKQIPVFLYAWNTTIDEKVEFNTTFDESGNIVTSAIKEFLKYLLVEEHHEYHIIAHNGGKYDNHFLINEIQDSVTDEKITVEKLAKGTRYLSIVVKYTLKQKTHTITFGDSLTKIQSPLEKMPKMFDLKAVSKTWCPYDWLNKDNLHFRGKLMEKSYFGYDTWKAEKKAKFDDEFSLKKDQKVVMKAQLNEDGSLKSGQRYWKISRVIDVEVTLYELVQYGKALKDLKTKDDIFIYCDVWETFIKEYCKMDVMILGQAVLKHQQLFKTIGTELLREMQMASLGKGLEIDYENQCFVDKINKKKTKSIKAFLKENEHRIRRPYASVKESYHGGRTEVFKPYYKCRGNEKIAYIDITSMYPAIMANFPFPFGKPERIRDVKSLTLDNIDHFFGFIYCKIKSPDDLEIPLLCVKTDKLAFPLGRLVKTFTSVEVKEAVKLGYVVEEVFEIIHFPEKSNDLFRSFLGFGI